MHQAYFTRDLFLEYIFLMSKLSIGYISFLLKFFVIVFNLSAPIPNLFPVWILHFYLLIVFYLRSFCSLWRVEEERKGLETKS